MTFARSAWAGVALITVLALAGCGKASHSSTVAPPATTPPTTASTPGSTTDLTVAGVGPGVMETPFYTTTTVTSVQCGTVPGGIFVEVQIPADPTSAYHNSALTQPTVAVVVNGEGVVKDSTGKTLYEQQGTGDLSGRSGAFVLSMPNVTDIGGNGKEVVIGAVNINGNYTCPAANTPYPGL